MARYAILTDMHANIEALEAVLSDADKNRIDDIWFLGDLVVYGTNPNECVSRLHQAVGADKWPGISVVGNNDQAIIDGKEPETVADLMAKAGEVSAEAQKYRDATTECHQWTVETLTEESKKILAQLGSGPRNVLTNSILVHASPCDPVGMAGNYLTNTMEAEEALWCLGQRGNDMCLFGHTHLTTLFKEISTDRPYNNCELLQRQVLTGQTILLDGHRLLINPGSVGQPRDGDNRAAYAILDDGANTIQFRRVEYNRQKTFQALEKSGLSESTVLALQERLNTAR